MDIGDIALWERLVTWVASNWPAIPLAGAFYWWHMRPLRSDLKQSLAALYDVRNRLDVHEAKCEERWKDMYRRVDQLEKIR